MWCMYYLAVELLGFDNTVLLCIWCAFDLFCFVIDALVVVALGLLTYVEVA